MMLLQPAHRQPFDAIAACLAETAARDPMLLPVEAQTVLAQEAWVALVEDRIVGVAWWESAGTVRRVSAQVLPGYRRQGIGSALLHKLTGSEYALITSCDAGHPRTRKFIAKRGFELEGMVFFQRWDGEVADVPRAFASCSLDTGSPEEILAVITAGSIGCLPQQTVDQCALGLDTTRSRVARIDNTVVGALVAHRGADAWSVTGFAVLPQWRRRGVGRALLGEIMRDAAQAELGVVLRVHHADIGLHNWTSKLGFWTYRTWAYFRRPGLTQCDSE